VGLECALVHEYLVIEGRHDVRCRIARRIE
jgi:hypothetical protein